MQSLILYGSDRKLTKAHKLVTGEAGQPDYYVRAKVFNGDACEALDKAKPMEGESVLNTVDDVRMRWDWPRRAVSEEATEATMPSRASVDVKHDGTTFLNIIGNYMELRFKLPPGSARMLAEALADTKPGGYLSFGFPHELNLTAI